MRTVTIGWPSGRVFIVEAGSSSGAKPRAAFRKAVEAAAAAFSAATRAAASSAFGAAGFAEEVPAAREELAADGDPPRSTNSWFTNIII